MKDTQIKQITFSNALLAEGERRAKKKGISFPEYIRHLLLNDIDADVPTFEPTEEQKRIIEESLTLKDEDLIDLKDLNL